MSDFHDRLAKEMDCEMEEWGTDYGDGVSCSTHNAEEGLNGYCVVVNQAFETMLALLNAPSGALLKAMGKASFAHVITFEMSGDGVGEEIVRTHTCSCGESWTGYDPSEQSMAHRMAALWRAGVTEIAEAETR